MNRRFGASYGPDRTRFRVWADPEREVELVWGGRAIHLEEIGGGLREAVVAGVRPGDRYGYRIDGAGPLPDPASRWQPEGVHGLSAVVDPWRFEWSDADFLIPALDRLIIYELHTGTFTPSGTFRGVAGKLAYLRDLGITAIELMPLAECPGRWNWGYDGVGLFAPCHNYGAPDDLRALVNEVHRLGIAVLLDVVFNHLGPDGAYHGLYSRHYRSPNHQTPWGDGMNFDNEGSLNLRSFFIESALHWLEEYHVDGFRLDATHAILDDSPMHFLKELAEAVHATRPGALVIAEDNRNESTLIRPEVEGGFGVDGVWADDFHHQVRRRLAGDRHGYYADYEGGLPEIVRTMREGWFYSGQLSPRSGKPRGTPATGIEPSRMVIFLQNHDQIGNRAFGERLHHQIHWNQWLAASALLLLAPETPLVFMGQEWGATSPFLYFTDHHAELGKLVTEGRRKEFAAFPAFSDLSAQASIPDPQAEATFRRSKLEWSELSLSRHADCLAWYRALLGLRRMRQGLPTVELAVGGLIRVALRDGLFLVVCLDDDQAAFPLERPVRETCSRGAVTVTRDCIRFGGPGASVVEEEST